jgi:hypothetical protein
VLKSQKCTFKPKILKKSDAIVKERSLLVDCENVRDSDASVTEEERLRKFDYLYLEALKRRQKQEILSTLNLDDECTFKPKLISKATKKQRNLL